MKNQSLKSIYKAGQHTSSLRTYFILITETQIFTVIGIDWKFKSFFLNEAHEEEFRPLSHLLIFLMSYFKQIHCRWESLLKWNSQIFFFVIRAHRSIPYNSVHVKSNFCSGRYCSHHTTAPQMLLISGLQKCAVVMPAARNKCLPQTCMVWICETDDEPQ